MKSFAIIAFSLILSQAAFADVKVLGLAETMTNISYTSAQSDGLRISNGQTNTTITKEIAAKSGYTLADLQRLILEYSENKIC